MTNGRVTTKEHLEGVFREFKERYLSDQLSRDNAFEDFKEQLDEKDKRLAEKYKADLQAYPNIEDFNKLQDKVTTEFSASVGRAKAYAIGAGLLAIVSPLFVAVWLNLK